MGQESGSPRPIFMRTLSAVVLAALLVPASVRADDPYARSRDYDLQNVRTHLWFDLEHKGIRGEVTHSISALRDDLAQLKFDSADLKIQSVTVDGKPAKFSTTATELIVTLAHPARRSERHEVLIRYEGTPKKGIYFVMPDKDYPDRVKEIWTQGESEDTHFYIPIYDYPNARTTSEMLLTVPASWVTVSNGRLVSVKDETDGTKTWDWKQSEPLSTYLISAVAGEFVEKKDAWRGTPLRYIVPRGQEFKIDATFATTKAMLDTFSDRLGVRYPWAQYAQTSVDDFVVGGMENTSATTLTSDSLVHPKLTGELHLGVEGLNSHELAHQWFGDLVTCKDWANIWLNEGFATYFEHFWTEKHFGADESAYEFWGDQSEWFEQKRLYAVPIVTREAADSIEYEGNIYNKGSWVLRMLREKLGDEDFFHGIRNYLESNRGQNVVTADLQKAIEQATSINVDKFFHQWVYRAGAPRFEVSYTFDEAAHQVKLDVKQTQKVEGLVGIFDVPVNVEVATAGGHKTYPIEANAASQNFTFPAESAPLMVVFDKGGKILKTLEFKRTPAALIYQLKNGETVPDRADAAVALGDIKDNPDVIEALGAAASRDSFAGVRAEAAKSLGKIGGPGAEKELLAALGEEKAWAREQMVETLGKFKDDAALTAKLTGIAANDNAYRVRGAAMNALAELKAPGAFETLSAAVKVESPDDTLRQYALHAFGKLEDARAVPILLEWGGAGKPFGVRGAAIGALGGLDKSNKEVTHALLSYLKEPYFRMKFSALVALGARGDGDAIGPLEDLLKSGELSIGAAPFIQGQIEAIKAQSAGKATGAADAASAKGAAASSGGGLESLVIGLQKLGQPMDEINARLGKIESQLGGTKK